MNVKWKNIVLNVSLISSVLLTLYFIVIERFDNLFILINMVMMLLMLYSTFSDPTDVKMFRVNDDQAYNTKDQLNLSLFFIIILLFFMYFTIGNYKILFIPPTVLLLYNIKRLK